jgi:hypothetical protein
MVHVLLKALAWQFRRELSEPLEKAKGANNLIGIFFLMSVSVTPLFADPPTLLPAYFSMPLNQHPALIEPLIKKRQTSIYPNNRIAFFTRNNFR